MFPIFFSPILILVCLLQEAEDQNMHSLTIEDQHFLKLSKELKVIAHSILAISDTLVNQIDKSSLLNNSLIQELKCLIEDALNNTDLYRLNESLEKLDKYIQPDDISNRIVLNLSSVQNSQITAEKSVKEHIEESLQKSITLLQKQLKQVAQQVVVNRSAGYKSRKCQIFQDVSFSTFNKHEDLTVLDHNTVALKNANIMSPCWKM